MLINRVIVGSMYTNAYVVSVGKKECILIDPGADAALIVRRLETMNLIPQAILFTHGHIDHTSATRGILEHYASRDRQIAIGIHREDRMFLGSAAAQHNRDLFASLGENAITAFESFDEEIPEAEFFFADGETVLDTDLVAMHTPGHSPGSTCFYSESRQVLFSGDTLFFNSIGRTDIPGGDAERVRSTVSERLFELPAATRVFPGHGPLTTIEREKMNNPLVSEGATI
ncbi:MAG: MBL fold metallo-hydrolase [Spirochaetaceae bacterium]|nr:MAG: MBL fold metallo-hydrolase [Spirochaetaceae bacterium]